MTKRKPSYITRSQPSPLLYRSLQESQTAKTEKNRSEYRVLGEGAIRTVEGEGNERKFILSFSSEVPYERWYGVEILDHGPGACDLTRLQEIGCMLFNHDRDFVLGKLNRVWLENARGCAEVEFDQDAEAEKIYQKVKSGTLKGVSVGYRRNALEEVMPNKLSADGRFQGPAEIVRKWEPFEISIVSVPADPTVGVGRDLEEQPVPAAEPAVRTLDFFERQLQINKNKTYQEERR